MTKHLECQYEGLIPLPREKAFKLIIDFPSRWWRSPFQGWAGEGLEASVEPFPGGSCYEMGKDGQRRIWGTVLSIEDPLYIRLAWQVSQDGREIADPAAASRVMMNFREAGDATRLEVVHSEFLRHGEGGADYRSEMAGPNGWAKIISQIQNAAKVA